jgi:hypothetical protein
VQGALEVVRHEKEHAQHAGTHEHRDQERTAAVAVQHHTQGQQWIARARLDHHEPHQQHGGDPEEREGVSCGPAVLGGLGESVH